MEGLKIGDQVYSSRLLIGSSGYPNFDVMLKAIKMSEANIVTVAIRRVKLNDLSSENLYSILKEENCTVLPNTAGCYTAKDAVLTAQLAREALGTDLIKLEVIGDDQTLFPDVEQLIPAASELIKDGFTVLPYCNDDPITCKKLEDIGCAVVMPLGAPIGSGAGIRNPYNIQIIRDLIKVPVIVDAGVGTASDATVAMELGCDGILLNTAVAKARNPILMASAMRKAVEAGREAFLSGRIPRKLYATASSPTEDLVT
ncbi:TPA: thiazole synthase [Candidatus Poribacteria bacterium]|nr:thiazole synthase [Candidatus Poribacteria bacterium]HIA68163.1 thiazole synthase [Candidatus Poribacteria bacterium]HIB92297.1 thiazole synthase [Candidatus Poribacteria bacterium]HIC02331.1 thiazole synthase [Candidatus Poribacteria bacterium]HIC16942.1 thiazole synthase [Candidatus Poribacteria bacterium]